MPNELLTPATRTKLVPDFVNSGTEALRGAEGSKAEQGMIVLCHHGTVYRSAGLALGTASAQTATSDPTAAGQNSKTTNTRMDDRRELDDGWFGLLGLAGLRQREALDRLHYTATSRAYARARWNNFEIFPVRVRSRELTSAVFPGRRTLRLGNLAPHRFPSKIET